MCIESRFVGLGMASAGVLALWLVAGCQAETGCVTDTECGSGRQCVLGSCEPVAGPNPDGFGSGDDTGNGSSDATDVASGADSGSEPDDGSGVQPDVADTGAGEPDTVPDTEGDSEEPQSDAQEEDVEVDGTTDTVDFDIATPDTTPPQILAVTPAPDATGVNLPFVVTVEFDEAIRTETVAVESIFLVDLLTGTKISGQPQLSADQKVVTVAPFPNTTGPARPFGIRVETIVQDMAGNKLAAPYVSTFYTAPPPQAEYEALALAYAPIITQAVGADPQHDYPTRLDLDDDWVSLNNGTALAGASEIEPAAYWDVAETKSHIYLTYVFLYPLRKVEAGATPVLNDTSGAMVVFRKFPALSPIAAYGYGRKGNAQDIYAWVVTGDALDGRPLTTGKGALDTLFPGGALDLYLTTPRHQACSWALGGPSDCELNAGIKLELKLMELLASAETPQTLAKSGGKWPAHGTLAEYGLHSLIGDWWIRRHLNTDEGLWGPSFDYTPSPGRPGASLKGLPASFRAAASQAGGRPPWAWRWTPSGVGQFVDLPEGTFFLDPAWFLAKRHQLEGEPFSAATGQGFSLDYCYHPYLGIDLRDSDPSCPTFTF